MTVPLLQTERLDLFSPEGRDVDAFVAYYGTERSSMNGGPMEPMYAWRAYAAHLGAWEINGFGMFAVRWRGEDRTLGLVGHYFPGGWPEREVGWVLFDPADEGKGIATEAGRACVAHAYGPLGWDTVVSYISPGNAGSIAVAERLGAVRDPEAAVPGAGRLPTLVYRHPRPERIAA